MHHQLHIHPIFPIAILFCLLGYRIFSKKIGWKSAACWLVLPTLFALAMPFNRVGFFAAVAMIMDVLLVITIQMEQNSRYFFGSAPIASNVPKNVFMTYDWQPLKRKTEEEDPHYLGPKPPLT